VSDLFFYKHVSETFFAKQIFKTFSKNHCPKKVQNNFQTKITNKNNMFSQNHIQKKQKKITIKKNLNLVFHKKIKKQTRHPRNSFQYFFQKMLASFASKLLFRVRFQQILFQNTETEKKTNTFPQIAFQKR